MSPMSSRKRQQMRRRRIFFLCCLCFLIVICVLVGILISRITAKPTSQNNPTGEGSTQEVSAPITNESDNSQEISEMSQQESLPPTPTIPAGYEKLSLSEEAIHEGVLILINKDYAYTFTEDKEYVTLYDIMGDLFTVRGTDVKVDAIVADPLCQMFEDFYEISGHRDICVLWGYRSKEEAEDLFNESVEENGLEHALMYVMKPGYSEHHTALGLDFHIVRSDISFDFAPTPPYDWFYENSQNYGFVLRYPEDKVDITDIAYESWHFRYLGIPNATAVYNEGLCLEEYIDFIKQYTADGEHYHVNAIDGNYEIYYCPGTDVIVPIDKPYEISGNNIDGFIVTVKASTN